MKYNPKEVKERPEYEHPDEGLCQVVIADAEDAISKNSGVDMVKLSIEVCEGQKGEGYKMQYYIVDGEYASTNIDSILRSCGKAENLDKVIEEIEMATEDFIGLTGTVMLKNEEYKGLDYPKIHYWIAAEVAEGTPTASTNKDIFSGKTVTGFKVTVKDDVDESDIPF